MRAGEPVVASSEIISLHPALEFRGYVTNGRVIATFFSLVVVLLDGLFIRLAGS